MISCWHAQAAERAGVTYSSFAVERRDIRRVEFTVYLHTRRNRTDILALAVRKIGDCDFLQRRQSSQSGCSNAEIAGSLGLATLVAFVAWLICPHMGASASWRRAP